MGRNRSPHRWDSNKDAGRLVACAGAERRGDDLSIPWPGATGARGPLCGPRSVPPHPRRGPLYNLRQSPVSPVRHTERQGWVGQVVNRGRVTKPYGYEIKSDAVVSFGRFINFPSIS